METTANNIMSKKKAPKGVFHGLASGFFSQKKKIVLDNVKHFVVLPSCLPISLDKKWIDSKIIKTPMEVSVKKLFALNINLLAVERKSTTAKTQLIRKIFSLIYLHFKKKHRNDHVIGQKKEINAVVIKEIPMNTPKNMIIVTVFEFGEIKSIKIQLVEMWQKAWLFLIEKNFVHVTKAVKDHEIWVFRDWFRVFLFTLSVGTTAHDFRTLLEGAGKKTCVINRFIETGNKICCAVVGFDSNNDLESAFYIKPILGGVKLFWTKIDLVWCEKYERFGHFALECNAPDAFTFKPSKIFKRVASDEHHFQLTKLYEKKSVLISRSAAFGGKSWAQVVSLVGFSDGLCFTSGSDSSFSNTSGLNSGIPFVLAGNSSLDACLASLEQSLKLLTDQVSDIVCKLSNIELNLALDMIVDGPDLVLSSSFSAFPNVSTLGLSSSKVLMIKVGSLESKLVVFEASIGLVLTKLDYLCTGSGLLDMDNLVSIFTESKLKEKVCFWIVNKFGGMQVFTSGLESGHLGASVIIVINSSLAKHVCKILEVPGQLLSIKLFFKNKLSVSILGLYTGVSLAVQFSQASNVNSLIAKAVNESFFIIFSGDFNENSSHKCASFKRCLDLGLVNFLVGSLTVKEHIWVNSRGVIKTIDYVFVFPNLVNMIVHCDISEIGEHFDIDH
ncbi:hypothetical protein G9A89_009046 [Geosiphon pyriformis]|nr:hypothetical protein G9A89_009046 [Geosiphon pyriformis]